jgi:hypothetical protein
MRTRGVFIGLLLLACGGGEAPVADDAAPDDAGARSDAMMDGDYDGRGDPRRLVDERRAGRELVRAHAHLAVRGDQPVIFAGP